ncbi:MAG: isoprenylcysteine carboxylmethyltransferase family protein, partial [Acidobacteriaceae bacterium]|nr:isoprenylcysteine carboxylmethyltransferase family protein [Acidobacteriaceae bacterium]
MPGYVYFILGLAWAVWLAPFIFRSKRPGKAQEVKVRARWGIVLVAVAFSVLWQGKFWERETPLWKLVLASSFFAAGWALSWTAVHALGRQWRIDAGLNPDHHLVRSGPYALVRHPIYTSMLCVLIGTGLIVTPWPLFVCALVLFIIGTEIR